MEYVISFASALNLFSFHATRQHRTNEEWQFSRRFTCFIIAMWVRGVRCPCAIRGNNSPWHTRLAPGESQSKKHFLALSVVEPLIHYVKLSAKQAARRMRIIGRSLRWPRRETIFPSKVGTNKCILNFGRGSIRSARGLKRVPLGNWGSRSCRFTEHHQPCFNFEWATRVVARMSAWKSYRKKLSMQK